MSNDLDRVLAELAQIMDDATDAETLANMMDISLPRARHYLRELHAKGLVCVDENGTYGLSTEGDAYIVAEGLDLDS